MFPAMKKLLLLSLIFFFFATHTSSAQCAMCKSVTESNMKTAENNVGRSLNTGILYLLAIPYLIGGIGAVSWYVNKRKARQKEQSTR